MAILFISHNLDLVAEICDRVTVMYAGTIAEAAPVQSIFATPRHPYTTQLLRCIPRLADPAGDLPTIPGEPPAFGQIPPGCPFAPRCEHAHDRCTTPPPLFGAGPARAACWLAEA